MSGGAGGLWSTAATLPLLPHMFEESSAGFVLPEDFSFGLEMPWTTLGGGWTGSAQA